MARGSAPLITALVSILLLGEHYHRFQMGPLLIIGASIITLAFTVGKKETGTELTTILLAFITAGFISSYSIDDGIGARIG